MQSSDDLKLDVPRAPDLLPLFVARAVTDDLLPPNFVTKLSLGATTCTRLISAHPRSLSTSRLCLAFLSIAPPLCWGLCAHSNMSSGLRSGCRSSQELGSTCVTHSNTVPFVAVNADDLGHQSLAFEGDSGFAFLRLWVSEQTWVV
jgi:hypothetical protein